MAAALGEIRIRGFRTARDVRFRPGALCALVGEANAGKSNLLAAIRALLDPAAPPLTRQDASREDGPIRIGARLTNGRRLSLGNAEDAPPVLFFPAELRATDLVARPARRRTPTHVAARLVGDALAAGGPPRQALVAGLEACLDLPGGLVVLIEEPELFLRPQTQRYLYRVLERLAASGNQVVYSTHSPAFLDVSRLEQLALVVNHPETGTRVIQPHPVPADDAFRAWSEFDAERAELFLARSAILVEGRTEKFTLPLVFRALGHDADRATISIVECGGKSNIPLFATICKSAGIPFVVVHDRDAEEGQDPIPAEEALNALILRVAGKRRTVTLVPDFEGVAGLTGSSHKPERALNRFLEITAAEIPEPLARAARIALRQALA